MAAFRHSTIPRGRADKTAWKTLVKDEFWGSSGLTGIGLVVARKGQIGGKNMFKIIIKIC
jgi:hypothetical protein